MNIFVEMPSGARSKGYDREEQDADSTFKCVASQLRAWPHFTADVVMTNEIGDEVRRERIANA
jgi:hypothetical protein